MFVTKLQAENFKRLEAVEIDLDAEGGITTISGPNGAGKTSVIDALASVIAGRNAPKIPEPIRVGEDKAVVIATTSDGLVITRRWKRKADESIDTSLEITTDVGLVKRSPQALLDGFVRGFMLDPLAFTRQDPKGQAATLQQIVELPFDPKELELQRREIFDTRTIANRETKALAGQLASLPEAPADVPDEERSAADLLAELQQVQAANRAAEQRVHEDGIAQEALAKAQRILEQAKTQLALAESAAEAAHEALVSGPAATETAHLEEQIRDVDRLNAAVREKKRRGQLVDAFAAAEARSTKLDEQLEEIAQRRRDGLAAAEFPVPGLSFDEEGLVTLNGVPFSQASAAEQLVASISIAGAASPELQLVLVRDASLLDSTNRALVEEYATKHGLRVVMEVVDEAADTGVVISEGRVRA
jgi:hypothetical protein